MITFKIAWPWAWTLENGEESFHTVRSLRASSVTAVHVLHADSRPKQDLELEASQSWGRSARLEVVEQRTRTFQGWLCGVKANTDSPLSPPAVNVLNEMHGLYQMRLQVTVCLPKSKRKRGLLQNPLYPAVTGVYNDFLAKDY